MSTAIILASALKHAGRVTSSSPSVPLLLTATRAMLCALSPHISARVRALDHELLALVALAPTA